MEQHSVQSAYLKNFALNGEVWVYDKESRYFCSRSPSKCTIESDFQSEKLEKAQNKEIESIAIRKMRGMDSGHNLSETEIDMILHWTALHSIRNKNYRENSGSNYIDDYRSLMNIEKLFTDYYRYIYTYTCSPGDYFITSDNPIIDFSINDFTVRVMTWSPTKAFLFTPKDGYPSHEAVSLPMMVNSMHYASCYRELYSNTRNLPLKEYISICEKWNLAPQFENMKFKVQSH